MRTRSTADRRPPLEGTCASLCLRRCGRATPFRRGAPVGVGEAGARPRSSANCPAPTLRGSAGPCSRSGRWTGEAASSADPGPGAQKRGIDHHAPKGIEVTPCRGQRGFPTPAQTANLGGSQAAGPPASASVGAGSDSGPSLRPETPQPASVVVLKVWRGVSCPAARGRVAAPLPPRRFGFPPIDGGNPDWLLGAPSSRMERMTGAEPRKARWASVLRRVTPLPKQLNAFGGSGKEKGPLTCLRSGVNSLGAHRGGGAACRWPPQGLEFTVAPGLSPRCSGFGDAVDGWRRQWRNQRSPTAARAPPAAAQGATAKPGGPVALTAKPAASQGR
ncbi:MAG: hypothetical protein CM15mP18_4780 [Methanobacteriota archaeon]|nr:MAG: hypothetical protein CM15mP18_4780 [Euryarchaeota archaeon]